MITHESKSFIVMTVSLPYIVNSMVNHFKIVELKIYVSWRRKIDFLSSVAQRVWHGRSYSFPNG